MTETIKQLTNDILRFRDERDWEQFHTIKNLIISLNIEASELLETVQWKKNDQVLESLKGADGLEAIADECADVFIYLLLICHECGIDLTDHTRKKISKNETKYPVEKAFGSARKYTEF
ncbi:MAG: nucleotide pyrophosphohydrolase [Alphaproteobacteria bacterium]|nr:nucleotide pyrophosphohydrolase [Alphaproteobacteria bacterium]|tara:strand:- start:1631 stop:1987 length:357 start_codon:yes stop_codon:yes gene_type:complete